MCWVFVSVHALQSVQLKHETAGSGPSEDPNAALLLPGRTDLCTMDRNIHPVPSTQAPQRYGRPRDRTAPDPSGYREAGVGIDAESVAERCYLPLQAHYPQGARRNQGGSGNALAGGNGRRGQVGGSCSANPFVPHQPERVLLNQEDIFRQIFTSSAARHTFLVLVIWGGIRDQKLLAA